MRKAHKTIRHSKAKGPAEGIQPGIRQQGATLITALVMLIVLTLMVVSALRSSLTNLKIAGNKQIQEEVVVAAQQATEVMLSSDFTKTPASAVYNIDINNDNTPDYTATIKPPVCTGDTPLNNSTPGLPPQCISSGKLDNSGIIFTSGVALSGTSWCDAQQWDLDTTVTDTRTGAGEVIHQGVSTIVQAGTTCDVALPHTP